MVPTRLFLAFAFGYFLTYLFRVVNAVAGPAISADLAIGAAEMGFLTSLYFFAFAAFQLPLGVLLDRYGPNRVQATLLVIAAAGSSLFAMATDLTMLAIGRALIGLGVSAGLMSALKTYSMRLPLEKLPLVNSLHMAAGSLGVLAGGMPAEFVIATIGWRGLFLLLAALSLAAAAGLFFSVRGKGERSNAESFAALVRGVGHVLVAPPFVRLAPLSVAVQASGMALIALWVGPWLREVALYPAEVAATILSSMGVAMIVGFALCGMLTNRLVAIGVPLTKVMLGGYVAYFGMLPLLIFLEPAWTVPVWIVFALLISFGPLSYPVLGASFPAALTGRVHTGLNFLVFVAAFALQWAFGVVVEALLPAFGTESAYDAALWGLVALQALAYVWYVLKAPQRAAVAAR
jgi:predicted MFS family arabinose efflux permease